MSNILHKQRLTSQELLILQSEVDKKYKKKSTAYIFLLFLGLFGAHRFYIGDIRYGVVMLIFAPILSTVLGLGFLWVIIDAILLSKRVDDVNDKNERDVMTKLGYIREGVSEGVVKPEVEDLINQQNNQQNYRQEGTIEENKTEIIKTESKDVNNTDTEVKDKELKIEVEDESDVKEINN